MTKSWLNRTVIGIGLASLFSDLSHETITAVLPAFLASLGVAAAALGTIEGVSDGLSSLAKLYGGWWADRLRHRKRLCTWGYGFMALSPAIIAIAGTWFVVLLGRVLAWVSRGIRTPARKVLLAEAVPAAAYGRAFGLERALDTAGAILAPLGVLGLLHLGLSHRNVIWLSALPALAAVAAILWLVQEQPQAQPRMTPLFQSFRGFGKDFKQFLTAVGLFGAGDFADTFYILYAVTVLTPALGADRAATLSVALYAVHNILYAACSYLGGWLSDRTNQRLVLSGGYLCAALAAVGILLGVQSLLGLVCIFALGGMGVGLYEAVEDAVAARLLPAPVRGSGFGALAVVTGLGDLFSSFAVGWLWATQGVGVAFGFALLFMAAGTGLMLRLAWRNRTHAS